VHDTPQLVGARMQCRRVVGEQIPVAHKRRRRRVVRTQIAVAIAVPFGNRPAWVVRCDLRDMRQCERDERAIKVNEMIAEPRCWITQVPARVCPEPCGNFGQTQTSEVDPVARSDCAATPAIRAIPTCCSRVCERCPTLRNLRTRSRAAKRSPNTRPSKPCRGSSPTEPDGPGRVTSSTECGRGEAAR